MDPLAEKSQRCLGCHHPRHSGTVTLAKDILCQWRCRGRCLTPKNCKIHGSEAEIRFRSHRAVETLGPMNEDGVNFLLEIGRRLSSISGDSRETSFLLQRVSVTLQRYNGTPSKRPRTNWPRQKGPVKTAPDDTAPSNRPRQNGPVKTAPTKDITAPDKRARDITAPDKRAPDITAPVKRAPDITAPVKRAPDIRANKIRTSQYPLAEEVYTV